jgi:ketosteroid isomerase-like protein
MSENLDLVRSIYADWERGEFSHTDWADPQIEYVIADGPDPTRWTGVAAMRQGERTFLKAWEDLRVEGEEYRELDDESVLVLVQAIGRGKTSGVELGKVGTRPANLFYVRDGKVTRLVLYFDREYALADLGLEE